ncbi:MAG: methyltransferase domain-containing protein [Chthoniobacterales bacterium]
MIETSNPEIDVNELMEQIRREAAKIQVREHRPLAPPRTPERGSRPLPPIPRVEMPPAVGLSQPITANKERLERALGKARQMIEVSSSIPKFLRGLFRRQGGFNRSVLDSLSILTKTNLQLQKRVQELMVVAGQQNEWMRNFAGQGHGMTTWMHSAGALVSSIPTLTETAAQLEARLSETDHLDRLRETSERQGEHLRNLQVQMDRQRDASRGLRSDLDATGEHLRNLQVQMDGARGLRSDLDLAGEHLRNLQAAFDTAGEHLRNLQGEAARHEQRIAHLLQMAQDHAISRAELQAHVNHFSDLRQSLTRLEERQADDAIFIKGELSRHGTWLQRNSGLSSLGTAPAPIETEGSLAPSDRLDSFYLSFENRFRGERAEIKNRVRFYLPILAEANAGTSGRPILDVGCGRGEWLELLHETGLEAEGVDLNRAMVAQCEQRKLRATYADALQHLRSLGDASLGAVTGFHIIEHLPLAALMDLFAEARRVLQPGGLAIFESPNCKNLTVGACNFNIDPTHRNPVFPETAQFMLETHGFEQVHLEYLAPADRTPFAENDANSAVLTALLYGPQDFAVIARKPLEG